MRVFDILHGILEFFNLRKSNPPKNKKPKTQESYTPRYTPEPAFRDLGFNSSRHHRNLGGSHNEAETLRIERPGTFIPKNREHPKLV